MYERGQMASVALVLLIFASAVPLCKSDLIIDGTIISGNETSYSSVPLHFGSSPDNFAPVSGFLVLGNQTDAWLNTYFTLHPNETATPPMIIVDLYRGPLRPYFELALLDWHRKYSPVAVVVVGESYPGQYAELGVMDQNQMGYHPKEIEYPLVQTRWIVWTEMQGLLLNNTEIRVTVTDTPKNPWRAMRRGWWFPTQIAISSTWAIINASLCAFLLSKLPFERTLAVVVLWLELASNLLRLPFLVDPFAHWLVPVPVANVFYSMSFPIHIGAAIIVIFFWLELTTTTVMNANGGFLASRRWPAAVVICIIVIAEFVVSALRAAIGVGSSVLLITSGLYLVVISIVALTYFYVYWQVRRFFSSMPKLKSNHRLILRVSLRLLLTAISFLFLIGGGIISSLNFYWTPIGQTLAQTWIFWTLNAGSSMTISAFIESVLKNHSSKSDRTSSRLSTEAGALGSSKSNPSTRSASDTSSSIMAV